MEEGEKKGGGLTNLTMFVLSMFVAGWLVCWLCPSSLFPLSNVIFSVVFSLFLPETLT